MYDELKKTLSILEEQITQLSAEYSFLYLENLAGNQYSEPTDKMISISKQLNILSNRKKHLYLKINKLRFKN
jgi:hypothetical protein